MTAKDTSAGAPKEISQSQAMADAGKLEVSYAHSSKSAYNEVIDSLQNNPSAIKQVANDIQSSQGQTLAHFLGINTQIEHDKKGDVTAIDFSQRHSSSLWGDITGAADWVSNKVSSGYHNVVNGTKDVVNAVEHHPVEALVDTVVPGAAVIDGIAHLTGTSNALDDVLKGAANEVTHHPLTVLKDVAVGAAVAGLAASGPVGWAVLAGGATAYAANDVREKGLKGAFDGVIDGGKGLVDTAVNGYNAIGIVDDPSRYSKAQVEAATKSLNQVGDVGVQMVAGVGGGLAGSAAAGLLRSALIDGAAPEVATVDAAAGTRAAAIDGVPVKAAWGTIKTGDQIEVDLSNPATLQALKTDGVLAKLVTDNKITVTGFSDGRVLLNADGANISAPEALFKNGVYKPVFDGTTGSGEGAASLAKSGLGEDLGTVNADGVRVLDAPETEQLYAAAKDANGELQFAKPDLKPGDAKYYQVDARQINLQDYPNGLRVGTTESKLTADSDITLANGDIIPKGNLPTGVQISGDTIHTPPEGVTLENGTVLKDGMKLPAGANLTGGQEITNGDWIITRNTTADGKSAYDMYTPHNDAFQTRWKPVEGQAGQYSPKSVPTHMTYLPAGKYQIPTSWGTAEGEGPAFLAQYGPGDYNIITLKDASETGYLDNPTNAAARTFVDSMPPK